MRPNKRAELVQKALEVFYRDGFHATGMDKLAAESGISKTSMYKHFRTKEDLILATLHLQDERIRDWLFRSMDDRASTPKDQLLAAFDALEEWFAKGDFRSCMFIKATAEYPDMSDPIHQQAALHKGQLQGHFEKKARLAGIYSPKELAQQLMLLVDGAIVAAHTGVMQNPAQTAKIAANHLFEAGAS